MISNNNPQYLATKQKIQTRHVHFELLNHQRQPIGELKGVATGGNISIDSTADIRRSGSIEMVIQKSTINLGIGSAFWIDKYIRVYVGIESLRDGKIAWNNCGLFIVDIPTYEYNATTNTISLSLLDLMAKLTGTRNGYVEKAPVLLKAGESIREAFIATLELAGVTSYLIDNPPSPGEIPNDMEFGQGTTFYNILAGLRDIYPNYEIFFDVNGTFVYRAIPTGKNDPVVVDDDIWKNVVIAENSNVNLGEVKNAVEVFGRVHEPQHFASAENFSVDNTIIKLAIPDVTKYTSDMIYGFEASQSVNINNPYLEINDNEMLPIVRDDGDLLYFHKAIFNKGDFLCVQYIITYSMEVDGEVIIGNGENMFLNKVNSRFNKKYTSISQITEGIPKQTRASWRWLGHLQAHGYAEDTNPRSPYYVKGPVGKIYLPLFNGVYANCITDDLAQQRANFELYLHSHLKDNVTLQCVPVFWLDVNLLVSYTSGRNNETNKYLIKNINFGLDVNDTMSVTMMRYYPINA